MAASKKRKQVAAPENNEESEESQNESEDMEDEEEEISEEEVMVDFEARAPDDGDFHGIKALLLQLLPKAQINVSEITDLLIEQNYISSVLKQCSSDDNEAAGEDDDEMDSGDVVFGILSVINLMEKRDKEFNKQLRAHLLDKCQKNCIPEKLAAFEKELGDDKKPIGLILSERFINIPPKIALPLYESFSNDLTTAIVDKKKPFEFDKYLMISKIVEDNETKSTQFINAEEELLFEESSFYFDYSVSAERDSGLIGNWEEDDTEAQSKRRVMLVPATKFGNFMCKLRAEFA